ncbi:MAG: SDR family NAD(P)-dependent oxidoreductase [Bacteroidetes bacterium]|nr:SDR family NAD(P)-dependent oxidoreductase [Bacteroidota bacterium]
MKIALITGATSGIGEATAETLARLGYNLIITGRRTQKLLEVKSKLIELYHVKVLSLSFDVRNRNEVEESLGTLTDEWGKIDLLINNAGLALGLDHIQNGNFDDWDRMIDTNVKGALNVTRIIAPMMCAQKRGHIINMGSIAGVQVYENGGVYCASKHAMHALTQSMRIDMLKDNIKVTEIRPGMVDTEFSIVRFHGDKEKAKKVYNGVQPLQSDDIANVIEWIVKLPEHININDVEIMPSQQADAHYTVRN